MNISFDNINATVLSGNIDKLQKDLTTFAPGYIYSKLYKLKKWDGKVSLLKNNSFPTGLISLINPNFIRDNRQITPIKFIKPTIPLRDYQLEIVKKSLTNQYKNHWWPRGVLRVATGGGKTVIAAAMIQASTAPTIFLVHRNQLVRQTVKVFNKYDIETSEDFRQPCRVVVTTIQSLMSWAYDYKADISKRLKHKRDLALQYLNTVEQVFVDEAHLIGSTLDKGNLFTKALQLIPNAYMRWGLTATPFMREKYHNLLLAGATGPELCNVSTKFLIDNGFLAKPEIFMIKTSKRKIIKTWPECYDLGVVMNEERNSIVAELLIKEKGPILVLVDRIGHGNLIQKISAEKGLNIDFISGEDSLDIRENKLEELESGKIKALIASSIWDAGIDIPSINTLILAGGGNSESEAIQHLGRGLRKTETKSTVKVYDFMDGAADTLKKHSINRLATWRNEGHEVKVLDYP